MKLFYRLAALVLILGARTLYANDFLWVEGEEARRHNFAPGPAPLSDGGAAGASGGVYLKNDAKYDAEKNPVRFAEYEFQVKTPGNYRLWIASTPLVAGWASTYSIGWKDQGQREDMTGKKYTGVPYGRGKNEQFFFWHDAGTRSFAQPGTYTLRIESASARKSDEKVIVFIDALALTPDLKYVPAGNRPAGAPGSGLPTPPKGTMVWRECELPDKSNLTAKANVPFLNGKGQGASGGIYFNIDKKIDREAAPAGYYAEYTLEIPAAGLYHLWLASTPLNAGWASPYSIQWDGGEVIDLAGRKAMGPAYGFDHPRSYFFWTKAGTKAFAAPGTHTLRIIADRPRGNTDNIRVFLDAIALTSDPAWNPRGNRPPGSPWPGLQGKTPEERAANYRRMLYDTQMLTYPAKLKETNEQWNDATAEEVIRKISVRPLPAPSELSGRKVLRFGLHGIEKPFVQVGVDEEKTAAALDLLARSGVEFLRTAEPCWHRLGGQPGTFNYRQLDYEMALARKHGMKLMVTMGFAPAQYGKGKGNKLAACKPEYYGLYRDYLKELFEHIPAEMIHSVELANEVDASHVWWVGDSTPEDYVAEAKMTREALDRAYPGKQIPFLGFSATWASVERDRHLGRGRAWIERAFDAGADQYFDGYSLHYTWSPPKWGFADWLRAERLKRGFAEKPLHNSEESCYGHPGDIVKLFARNLFLQDMESVTYFLARDFQEMGNLLYSGLFDLNWRPKLRLLAFAASTDAMRGRRLAGMADPDNGLEAYVLEKESADIPGAHYSIVMWALDRNEKGMHSIQKSHQVDTSGWHDVREAVSWRLDPVVQTADGTIPVSNEPVIVYTDRLPEWKLLTAEAWRKRKVAVAVVGQDAGILPGQAMPDGR